jgi:integrase
MGIAADEAVAHGFRATARTLIAEKLSVPEQIIEAQLAHTVKDSLGTAYNRTEWLQERVAMMQRWSDYLDQLRDGATVIPLRAA